MPYLAPEYFLDQHDRVVFNLVHAYLTRYNATPTLEALQIDLANATSIGSDEFVGEVSKLVDELFVPTAEPVKKEWLKNETEKFCQDRAIYNAIRQSVSILEDKDKKHPRSAIPSLLSDALAVGFNDHIGHDFMEDSGARFEFYHKKERKVGFDLEYFNRVTGGGVEPKTLNILSAGTGVGKTLAMCHFAAHNLMDAKNVLYVTMEMAEEKIAERIDANLLDVPISVLCDLPREAYDKKMDRLREKTLGRLIIKEYPTVQAGAGHFRHLLNELRLKKNFVPDVIYVDYINLCLSTRYKLSPGVNSYTYVKAVAEELRGLAVEYNVAVWSATQLNRTGFVDSDPDLQHTSDSFGLPMTADFMVILVGSEELDKLDQILVKQTSKNRYGDPTKNRRFIIGIDRSKMRLYNAEPAAQHGLMDDIPVMDRTTIGQRIDDEGVPKKLDRSVFSDFK